MDGWIYEKVDEMHKMITYLVQELEADKKKGEKKKE